MSELPGLLAWILMGLSAGALASYLLPGNQRRGCLATVLIGVAGAILGGLLATALGFGGLWGYDHRGLVVATLGSILLLLVFKTLTAGRKS